MSNHDAYWLERALQDSTKVYNFSEQQLKKLRKEYEKAIKEIEQELFQGIFLGKEYNIERLRWLKVKINHEVSRLFTIEHNLTEETLLKIYEDGYLQSVFNIQQAIGYGIGTIYIAPRVAEQAISTAWSGKNYSERIWANRKKLGKKLEQVLTQGTIMGHSNAKMAQKLSKEMSVSFNNAARLVRTESNYVYNQATKAGYEAMGQDTYIFLATLDLRTSRICGSLDGKKFKSKDAKAGVNYPPMHPNCRSTTIPDVEEDENEVRLAKLNGEYYEVPASMTHEEWYQQHVVDQYGTEQAAVMKKMEVNKSKDRLVYADYKKTLGVDAPPFVAFQQVKYTKGTEWTAIKRQYKTFNKIETGSYTDTYKRKLKSTYRHFKKDGHEFTIHSLNRTIGQKTGKGKASFTNEDISAMLKKPHNYVQANNGHLVRYENDLAILQAADTKEIVSVVSMKKPKGNWKEV